MKLRAPRTCLKSHSKLDPTHADVLRPALHGVPRQSLGNESQGGCLAAGLANGTVSISRVPPGTRGPLKQMQWVQ